VINHSHRAESKEVSRDSRLLGGAYYTGALMPLNAYDLFQILSEDFRARWRDPDYT
jgi:hypothetical protein